MKLQKPKNENYCASVVKIKNIIPLENRDKIVHTNIYGNLVIVSKSTKVGDMGLYFPPECQLSEKFCHENNLYNKEEMNKDNVQGYISYKNRRIRAIKLGGNISNGLFLPLSSLDFINSNMRLFEDDIFDTLEGVEICRKYELPKNTQNVKTQKKAKKVSKVVDNQFRLHYDTTHLGRNIHKFSKDDIISITNKVHGTSGISSKVLIKNNLNIIEKILKKLGVPTKEYYYDGYGLYASRRVVKNQYENHKGCYYNEDIDFRKVAHEYLIDYMKNGMTFYYEIIGYLPSGAYIQKPFDYGYEQPKNNEYILGKHYGIQIYRITYTTLDGDVYEFSAKQVQQFCNVNNLESVRELFYGTVKDFCDEPENMVETIETNYFYKQCPDCNNKVPNEGVVVKIENLNSEAFKCKNFDFLQYETKQLDANETNIEDDE